MKIYTIVNEGYDVEVCHSVNQVFQYIGEGFLVDSTDGPELTKEYLKIAKSGDTLRIFSPSDEIKSDWVYKIQVHG